MDMLGTEPQPSVNDRCRTCMTRIGNAALNIFDRKIQNITIAEILHSFTTITFDEDDTLPSIVCQSCYEKLNSFYEFILHIENVDINFKKAQTEKQHLSFEKVPRKGFHFEEVPVEYNLLQGTESGFIKEENPDEEIVTLGTEDNFFAGLDDTIESINPCALKNETEQQYICKLCNKYFRNDRNYQRHIKKHLNFKKSIEYATNNSNLSKYKEILCDKESFICQHCSYSSNSKDKLAQHLDNCMLLNVPTGGVDKSTSQHNYKTDSIVIEVNTLEDNINSDLEPINTCYINKCTNYSSPFNLQRSAHIEKKNDCNELNFIDYQNKSTKGNHLETAENDFICEICKSRFKNKYSLSAHMRIHVEKGRILSCLTCGKVFTKVSHLKRHQFLSRKHCEEISTNCQSKDTKEISTGTEKGELVCKICKRICKNKHSMSAHMRIHVEKGRILSCLTCGKVFTKVSNLKEHQYLSHNSGNDIKKYSESNDAKNIPTGTEEGEFACEICDRRFKNKYSLPAHMRKHVQKGRILSCATCGKVFSKVSHLKRHAITHEDKLRFKCSICNKSYSTEGLLQQHSKEHKDAKICPLCQKAFTNMPALNTHMKTHTHNKLYLCSYCGKRFDSSTNLNQHHKRHIGIKTFVCSLCPRKFVTKGELTSHNITHTGERPHKCKQCSAVFTKNSSLVKHTYRHLGIKPHHCDKCFKKFTTKGSLQCHYRIHTGEKPYSCDICAQAFTQSNDLVKHRRRHLGEKLFKCDQCTESFRLKTELKLHISQHYIAQLQETNMRPDTPSGRRED